LLQEVEQFLRLHANIIEIADDFILLHLIELID